MGFFFREDIFVTSKLWNTKHNPEDVEVSCKQSLSDLGLAYLDLYLIHWPIGFKRGDNPFPKNEDGSMTVSFIKRFSTNSFNFFFCFSLMLTFTPRIAGLQWKSWSRPDLRNPSEFQTLIPCKSRTFFKRERFARATFILEIQKRLNFSRFDIECLKSLD